MFYQFGMKVFSFVVYFQNLSFQLVDGNIIWTFIIFLSRKARLKGKVRQVYTNVNIKKILCIRDLKIDAQK